MNFKPIQDNPLYHVISMLHKQNETLGKARDQYLAMEAERKHFESSLMLKGAGTSVAERKVMAEASDKWLEFHKALARLESVYKFQEFKMSILEKEYQAQYLALKLDNSLIKKEQ